MTPALLDDATREELRSKANEVERLVDERRSVDERPVAAEQRMGPRERRAARYQQVEDAVLDLTNALPAGTEDYEARQLFRYLIELRRAFDQDAEATDAAGHGRLAAMRMTDVLRRLERQLEHSALEDPDDAARFVFAQLDTLSATDLGRLLGVSPRTIGNWRRGSPVKQKVDRVKLVAQLVAYLRYSFTQTGLLMWFEHEADRLGARTPLQLMDADPRKAWAPLVGYARGGRGQLDV